MLENIERVLKQKRLGTTGLNKPGLSFMHNDKLAYILVSVHKSKQECTRRSKEVKFLRAGSKCLGWIYKTQ